MENEWTKLSTNLLTNGGNSDGKGVDSHDDDNNRARDSDVNKQLLEEDEHQENVNKDGSKT